MRYRISGCDSWFVRLLHGRMKVTDAFAYSSYMQSPKQPPMLMKWQDLLREVHTHEEGKRWNFVRMEKAAFEKVALKKNEEGGWRRKLTKPKIKGIKVEPHMWRAMTKHVKESHDRMVPQDTRLDFWCEEKAIVAF